MVNESFKLDAFPRAVDGPMRRFLPSLHLRLERSLLSFQPVYMKLFLGGDSRGFGGFRGKAVENRVSDGNIRAPWGGIGRNGERITSGALPLRREVRRVVRGSYILFHAFLIS
jgi:hypothetical protein